MHCRLPTGKPVAEANRQAKGVSVFRLVSCFRQAYAANRMRLQILECPMRGNDSSSATRTSIFSLFADEEGKIMKLDDMLTNRHIPFQRLHHPPVYTANRIAQALHVPGKEMAKT